MEKDNVRVRLQNAAMELFLEQGYDKTTAAGIAARTGVTERTFFRHFPDKREVLFDGAAVLGKALTEAIAVAPDGMAPLDILFQAFQSVTELLVTNRPFAKPRHDLIAATPALRERELAKHEALGNGLATALEARGVEALQAALAARAGMAAFVHATVAWLDDPHIALDEQLVMTHRALCAVVAPAATARAPAPPRR